MIQRLKFFLKSFPLLEKCIRNIYLYVKYIITGNILFKYNYIEEVRIYDVEKENNLYINNPIFFGYYDKSPWNKQNDNYLIHKIHNGNLSLCLIDNKTSKLIELDKTDCWNYQQGAMLQWVPNSDKQLIIYNAINENKLGSYIYDVEYKSKHFIKWPVQALNPNGIEAISLNYYRLRKMNLEYSYSYNAMNFSEDLSHESDGLWRFNIFTGQSNLIINLKKLINFKTRQSMKSAAHGINHVMYSPSGDKVIFIHRWVTNDYTRFSRLYVMNEDGTNLKLLLDDDSVSHYCWLNNQNILTFSKTHISGKRFYQIDVNTGELCIEGKNILDKYGDGHPSLSADKRWIVIDSYPGSERVRRLLLWDLKEKKLHEIAKFHSPIKYERYNRCDLHPRWHPCKPLISVDSTHTGIRKNYIVDVSSIVGDFNE